MTLSPEEFVGQVMTEFRRAVQNEDWSEAERLARLIELHDTVGTRPPGYQRWTYAKLRNVIDTNRRA
jgi:hypothetical protein